MLGPLMCALFFSVAEERLEQLKQEAELAQLRAQLERQGQISPAEGAKRRQAAEVAAKDAYHPGYKIPCEMRGDRFFPVIITNHGGWYRESKDFLVEATHSGDKAAPYGVEAERFDHY